jgi:hypothetical protein
MTPEELYEKMNEFFGYGETIRKSGIIELIKRAKSEWENRAYPDTEADGYVFCGKCGKMT